jgi:hypothetical protein
MLARKRGVMQQSQRTSSFDFSVAVQAAVDAARAGSGLLRVNDAANLIIMEHGLAPQQQPEVIDALCQQCIRQGISIEFQAREAEGLHA